MAHFEAHYKIVPFKHVRFRYMIYRNDVFAYETFDFTQSIQIKTVCGSAAKLLATSVSYLLPHSSGIMENISHLVCEYAQSSLNLYRECTINVRVHTVVHFI